MKAAVSAIAILPLVLGLASCTSAFNSKWRKAVADAQRNPPTTLAGPWEGTWKSEASGHTGTLRAIAMPAPPPGPHSTAYTFHYEATWMGLLKACMKAEHEVVGGDRTRQGGSSLLRGQKDLGLLGGVYTFSGKATPEEFLASYRSSVDHGVFKMKRPVKE